MNKSPVPKEDDVLHELFVTKAAAATPYSFRAATGLVSEVNFAATRPMQFLSETMSVARVLFSGIELVRKNPVVVAELREQTKQMHSGIDLLSNDDHPFHAIVIANLCAGLEAGIEDVLLVALRFTPGLVGRLRGMGITKVVDVEGRDLSLEEARKVLGKLRHFSRTESFPPKAWLAQLDAVGLDVTLTDDECRSIRELIYIRNCLLHGGGRADDRCGEEASILPMSAGKRIRVTRPAMGAYTTACLSFARRIHEAAMAPFLAQSK